MVKLNMPVSERDKNIITIPERIGEIVGIIFVVLVAAFFAYHFIWNTGFMTASFGATGAVLLFGSFTMSIIVSGARAILGKRDKVRPFELVSEVYWAIAALWFLIVFPFNFAHFADPLPHYLRFVISWISNEIGWIILLLTVLVSIGTAIYTAVKLVLDNIRATVM